MARDEQIEALHVYRHMEIQNWQRARAELVALVGTWRTCTYVHVGKEIKEFINFMDERMM